VTKLEEIRRLDAFRVHTNKKLVHNSEQQYRMGDQSIAGLR
jgi:hypothetical protein